MRIYKRRKNIRITKRTNQGIIKLNVHPHSTSTTSTRYISSNYTSNNINEIRLAKSLKLAGKYNESIAKLELLIKSGRGNSVNTQLAKYELGLLHSQLGNIKEADQYLHELGFKFKLTQAVMCPLDMKTNVFCTSNKYATVYDDILPTTLLQALQNAFHENSPFWIDHGYPTDKFFSYNFKNSIESEDSLLQQVITYLLPYVHASFPHKNIQNSLQSIEWWCHIRDESSEYAHQMHYDLDEDVITQNNSKIKVKKSHAHSDLHPLVSSVLYLNDCESSAPTFITSQTLSSEPSDNNIEGWLCMPKKNRLLLFDAQLLHGVVPTLLAPHQSAHNQKRITLMFGWWGKEFNHSTNTLSSLHTKNSLGPNMRMPILQHLQSPPQKYSTDNNNATTVLERREQVLWPSLLRPVTNTWSTHIEKHCVEHLPSDTALIHIPVPIWVPIDSPPPSHNMFTSNSRINSSDDIHSNAIEFVSMSYLAELRQQQEQEQQEQEERSAVQVPRKIICGIRNKKHKAEKEEEVQNEEEEVVFVGKWFLKSLNEIQDEILN